MAEKRVGEHQQHYSNITETSTSGGGQDKRAAPQRYQQQRQQPTTQQRQRQHGNVMTSGHWEKSGKSAEESEKEEQHD